MDETGFDLCQSLNDYQFYSKLQFCEKALDQQNYSLALQYTTDAEAEKDTAVLISLSELKIL